MKANTAENFAPLTNKEKQAKTNADKKKEWQPILPVPDNAPEPKLIHPEYGRPTITYEYLDEYKNLLGYICRFEFPERKKEFSPYTYCQERQSKKYQWRWKGFVEPRPLYGLDKLAERLIAPVLVTEGEKPCDAARKMLPDYVVVTSPMGCQAPHKADWKPLKGRKVTIWADNDDAGLKYAEKVQELALKAGAVTVGIIPLPKNKPDKWDAADAFAEGWNEQDARKFLAKAKFTRRETYVPREFIIKNDGIYYDPDTEGDKPLIRICSKLDVIATTSDENSENHGRLLRWKDINGITHEWAMPMSLLKGDGGDLRGYLLDRGIGIYNRQKLAEYVQRVEPSIRALSTSRIGWQGTRFVLPDTIIPKTEDMYLQSEYLLHGSFKTNGTLEQWQDNLGKYAAGNSRLILAICAAFASPLLRLVTEESGGFHLRGGSSQGKTTALWYAGSVWGGGEENGFIQQWRATSNAIEATAQAHNDCLLCLDEMGQIDGKEAGEVAYMIANEAGKGRMTKGIELRKPLRWKLLFLSTGEISLADKMQEAGKRTHAGMETRLVDIPADAGAGYGLFENIHDFDGGSNFSQHLKEASTRYYGTPIRAFLEKIVAGDRDYLTREIRNIKDDFIRLYCPENADGQVIRVAGRFGLLLAAGNLATEYGILPVEYDDICDGLKKCFIDWLQNRGTIGQLEHIRAIAQVKGYFEKYGATRFSTLDETNHETESAKVERSGWKQKNDDGFFVYYVLPEVYKNICTGFDRKMVTKLLVEQGYLLPDNQGKNQYLKVLPYIGKARVYRFSASILSQNKEKYT